MDGDYPKTLGGKYRLGRLIGEGGMGAVFECTDVSAASPTKYAVKLLKLEQLMSAHGLERFEAECQLLARLDHPNIVSTYAWGVDAEWPYLVMELCRDRGLRPSSLRMMQERQPDQRLSPADVAIVVPQAVEALAEVHRLGLIHRDVKPDNFLVRQSLRGQIVLKLTDFGLAVETGESGGMAGTYDYMSPEQRRGEALDARTDVYSLGVMIYRLATGYERLGYESPTDVDPEIPAWVDALVDAAVVEDRDARAPDCGALLAMIPEATRFAATRTTSKSAKERARDDDAVELKPRAEAPMGLDDIIRPGARTSAATTRTAPSTKGMFLCIVWLVLGVVGMAALLVVGGETVQRWLTVVAVDLPARIGRTLAYYGAGYFRSWPLANSMTGSNHALAGLAIPYAGVAVGLVAAVALLRRLRGAWRALAVVPLALGLLVALPGSAAVVLGLAPVASPLLVIAALLVAMLAPQLESLRYAAALAAGAMSALVIATLLTVPAQVRYGPDDCQNPPQGSHVLARLYDCYIPVEANWVDGLWTSGRSRIYGLVPDQIQEVPFFHCLEDGSWKADAPRVIIRRLDGTLADTVPNTQLLDDERVYIGGTTRDSKIGVAMVRVTDLPPGRYSATVDLERARPFHFQVVEGAATPRAGESWRPALVYDLSYLWCRHPSFAPAAVATGAAGLIVLLLMGSVFVAATAPLRHRLQTRRG